MTSEARSDSIQLGEVWLLSRRNWLFIIASAALVLAAVAVTTGASRMKFKARGSLYLGELHTPATAHNTMPDQLDFLGGGTGDVGTEIEILRSENLVKRAILDSGLNVTLAPALGSGPPRYWRWRWARRDARLLDVVSGRLIASHASVTDEDGGSPAIFTLRFGAGGAYEVWRDNVSLGAGMLGAPFQGDGLNATLVAGKDGPPSAGATFTMRIDPIDEVVAATARSLTVTNPKVSGPSDAVKVVAVELVHQSPRAAAMFVEALLRAYLDRRQSWKAEEATVAETFVIGQVRGIKQSLDEAEKKLAEYKKGSSVVALGDESKGMIEQIGKYEQQRVAARLQVATFGQIEGLLRNPTAPIEQYLIGETEDPVLASLSANLALAQQELRRIEERFTADAPAAHEQRAQVDGQLEMVKNYVLGRFTRAQNQLASLNQMIGQFEEKLKTVPRAELDLAQLTRDTEVLSKMYSFLLERQQQAAVTKASTISRNRILDSPQVPHREDSPSAPIRFASGALLGLTLGLLLVILRRRVSPRYQTERQLRIAVGDLPIPVPILATVPTDAAGARRRARRPTAARARQIDSLALAPSRIFSESFRYLRTNIYCDAAGKDDKVLLVTSPSSGDGKTLCTLSLAAAFAADDKRVLVIEADMHRPSHHALFQQDPQAGLNNVLNGHCRWIDVVRAIHPPCGSFDAITAGSAPPGAPELLSSPQFQLLLEAARATYDFILIDSPPFPLVSDALIVSRHVDRVVTVLRLLNTDRRSADEHMRRLAATGARYGVVINDAELRVYDEAYGRSDASLTSREIVQLRVPA